jgi:serine/threonine protein kinase
VRRWPSSKLLTPEDVDDVRREIQIMHHLAGHRSIVDIEGAYEDPLYVHIVMELYEGGSPSSKRRSEESLTSHVHHPGGSGAD